MKSLNLILALLSASLMLPLMAQAEVRRDDSYLWRRAKTLVSGQQVFAFQSSYQNFSDRFTADGRVEPIGNQYARALTWNQLLKAEGANSKDIEDYMAGAKVRGNDVAATSTYQVNRQEVGFGFNWAYGLMRNWMIGIDIPLTLTTTRVQRQVEMTPQLQQGAGTGSNQSMLSLEASQLRERVRKLAEQELNNSGYDSIPGQKQTWDFGDISLRSQEIIFKNYNWAWAAQELVRFPTAQNPSVSDYVQNSQDEGSVNLGISSMLDYQHKKSVYGLRVGYVSQLPDSARMHSAPGSSGVDPKVNRDLGDWVWAALDTEYHLSRAWEFNIEYSFLSKTKDHYSGDTFSNEDYARMAENTDQQLHQTRVGMLYRIGSGSSRGGVSNKWLAALDYSYPWIGHNASEAAKTSLEIINYF
ncbi:MAG: hypothetical protein ACXVA9_06545 [Bdellovibrionales bacterium]